MYKALYRKWRPKTFSDISGQDHITQVLKRQCDSGQFSHAYLFCGTRGTGKTSSAKVLAKAVNCLELKNGDPCNECDSCVSINNGTATDVLELDAASNNGVNDIRELCDELVYPPTVLKKRVYIIDEVHMLSTGANNALLKTLEEPPEHVVFILATTELNKIPATIMSRCQRFEFKRISNNDIKDRLLFVSGEEDISIDEKAAGLLSKYADGSMRDALSLLESCSSSENSMITPESITNLLGSASGDSLLTLLGYAADKNIKDALLLINDYYTSAKSITTLINELLSAIRDIMVFKNTGTCDGGISEPEIKNIASLFTLEQLFYYVSVAEDALYKITRFNYNKKLAAELMVIRLCDIRLSDAGPALLARISELEMTVSAGTVPSKTRSEPKKAAEKPDIPDKKNDQHADSKQLVSEESVDFDKKAELAEQLPENLNISSLIAGSDIFTKDDSMFIVTTPFACRLLSSEENSAAIKNAVRFLTGKEYTINIKETNKPETKNTPINEL